jgi:polyisoprenoid-binding protein YceI
MTQKPSGGPNRLLIGGGIAVALLLAVGFAIFWSRGGDGTASATISAPTLDFAARTTPSGADAVPSAPALFRIDAALSEVRFALDEDLRGSRITVVGTTDQVAGDIIVDFANPAASQLGTIRINMRTLRTDQEFRDRAIRGEILQSANDANEFSDFVPTAITGMPASVTVGTPFTFQVTGDFTLKGITRSLTFDVTVTPTSATRIEGTATTTIQRADYELTIPSVPGVANVEEAVELSLLFVATAVDGAVAALPTAEPMAATMEPMAATVEMTMEAMAATEAVDGAAATMEATTEAVAMVPTSCDTTLRDPGCPSNTPTNPELTAAAVTTVPATATTRATTVPAMATTRATNTPRPTAVPPTATPQAPAAALFRIVSEESLVSFALDEDLRGQRITVVGKTDQVAGDIIVDFANPAASEVGTIRINMRTLRTDQEFRDRAIRGQILQTAEDANEFSDFVPTAITGMPASVTVGTPFTFQVTGDFTLKGITRSLTFDVTVTAVSATRIEGVATATIAWADYDITIPEVPSVANIEDEVELTLSFVATAVP